MAVDRTVSARWDGGLRAVVDAGGFEIVVDEPESVPGGTGAGPQPTDMLLGAVSSCFVIAMAWTAAKRGTPLAGLQVAVTGSYDGPRFSRIRVVVEAEKPVGDELADLVTAAQRVCYVTRTLAASPEIDFVVR